ncbi:MAG: hypothetical protein GYB50_18740 [Rhodobacteraceae bacterium]|nr:hypothetical protein [Paracoccaceae bacterium]
MGQDRITLEERAAIERATAEGRVTRVAGRIPLHMRQRMAPKTTDREPASKAPRPYRLPEAMSVREALEWAFATERASFEFDEVAATSGAVRQGRGIEALLFERGMIGTTVDVSPGRSEPAEEATIIASVVRHVLPFRAACVVADFARARREPDWMADAEPRILPVEWVYGRGGARGRTGDAAVLGASGWPHHKRRNRRGAIVEDVVLFTPCTWSPTATQIARARRDYLEWWGHLLEIRWALQVTSLRRFRITNAMPPMTPWGEVR